MASLYSFCPTPSYGSANAQCVSPPATSAATSQPRISYFITRSNGVPVPLIPADELPFTVKLQNVPRVLTPDQTYGLTYVGSAPYTGLTFKQENNSSNPAIPPQRSSSQPPAETSHARSTSGSGTKQFLAPDALARQAVLNNNTAFTGNSITPRPLSAAETSKSWRRNDPVPNPSADPTQSVIDAILRTSSGAETAERLNYRRTSPPPSGVIPDPDRKTHCTYWILHGDCGYVQQGCRYKHEMPDKEKLAQIGIHHVPRWWLEKNAAVKCGAGGGGTLGVLRKPEEWVRGSISSESSKEEEEKEETTKDAEVAAKEVKFAVKDVGQESGASKSPIIPPTRPSTPAEKIREPSSGEDLIDFAPLLPGLSPSTPLSMSSGPSTPPSPMEPPKRTPKTGLAIKASPVPVGTPKTTRVFVPAGESAEKHIADMKKREQRSGRHKTFPRTPSPTQASKTTREIASDKEKGKTAGLGASRWASIPESQKRTRSGCRPRRPVAVSPVEVKGGADPK